MTPHIYVASSWRNMLQQDIVQTLRAAGLSVYDFRNPSPGDRGFAWSDIDPDWKAWSPAEFREKLIHPTATAGFFKDKRALDVATHGLLVMPAGRSAHLEIGYLAGRGVQTAVFMPEAGEPELMYLLTDRLMVSMDELLDWAQEIGASRLSE